jgi:3-oxoacyl-[acyl-carrier protein] reductase
MFAVGQSGMPRMEIRLSRGTVRKVRGIKNAKERVMSTSLEGKIALVTGGSRGIGRAIALRLGRDGALVGVHYGRDQRGASSTVKEIESAGGSGFPIGTILGTLSSVEKLFELLDSELVRRTGSNRFDILVNNAGITADSSVEDASEEIFDEVFAVNVKVPFFIAQKAIPRLRDAGRIINISSGATRIAFPNYTAYAMTKGALNVLTLNLAKQLGPRGITVNSLAPGITDTDMSAEFLSTADARKAAASLSALGRIGRPDDVADVAAFLASNDARWVTGQYVDAEGGLQL